MNKALIEMFKYNAWASHELFQACRLLSDDQLDTRVQAVSGTVRELLMHIAGGQQTQILRTQGRQNEGELNRWSVDTPDLDGWFYAASVGYGQVVS